MRNKFVTPGRIERFSQHLQAEERSAATVEKYLREVRQFAQFLNGEPLDKAAVIRWKNHLLERNYSPSSINGKLTALSRFLTFCGRKDCLIRHIRIQRKMFREDRRELSREEYMRLCAAAMAKGKERVALLMETICATGIRVSELQYITVEALGAGKAEIALKGKIRTILIPGKLCRKLLKYARKQKIASGEVFRTRSGSPLSRKQAWAEMKAVCTDAKVEASKVFPHNLRHLFARCFYKLCRDVAKLADVLGHTSIETTRIYLMSTGSEHAKALDRLGLIS